MWKAMFHNYQCLLIPLKVLLPRFRWVERTLSMILSSAPMAIQIQSGVGQMLIVVQGLGIWDRMDCMPPIALQTMVLKVI